MSPRFEIAEAKAYHCGIISRSLRADHRQAAELAGVNIHREILSCYNQSSFRRAWKIDGKLAALGGVIGTLASSSGVVWLALSEEASRHPKAVVGEARRQLSALMSVKRELRASLFENDEASIRLAIFLRFQIIGAAWDGPAETKAGRRLLAREIAGNADARVAVGNVLMIPMSYKEMD